MKQPVLRSLIPALVLLAALAGCGPSVYFVTPKDWEDTARRDSVIASFAPQLKDVTIFLDPGHGGEDRSGIGPAEDVVEADLNLHVALRLRECLRQAGANVIMSREGDETVPLETRAQQANANKARIFLSIHHNAAGDPTVNYTASFYHARSGTPGYAPSSQDLARYIQRDLAYVLGNPGSLMSFDGTVSDDVIYPGKGFAVLREATMTAVLVECAFFSSEYEEQRLRIPEFNDIEAWGIFRGIGKYLRAGIPALSYASPAAFDAVRPRLQLRVSDLGDILDESIRVFIDTKEEGFSFNRKTGIITVTSSEELAPGYHRLVAQVRNANGNSSSPFEVWFAVGKAPAALRAQTEPPVLPPGEQAFSLITVTAHDSSGAAMPDGLPVRITSSAGMDTTLTLRGGRVQIAIAPAGRERVSFEAANGPVTSQGSITVSADAQYTRGTIMSSDGKPVPGAQVLLPGGTAASTNAEGTYIISGSKAAGLEVVIRAAGYFGKRDALADQVVQDPVVMTPVARGMLHGKTVFVDLLSAAPAPEGRVDARVAAELTRLLAASGATVRSLAQEGKTRKERAELLAAQKGAIVVQLGMQSAAAKASVKVNGMQASKGMSDVLARRLAEYSGLALQPTVLRMQPRDEYEKSRQLQLLLPAPGVRSYDERALPYVASGVAWALYQAILQSEGYKSQGTKTVEASVTDPGGAPAAFVPVELNLTLRAVSDAKGIVRFRYVAISDDDVRVPDAEGFTVSSVRTDVNP